MTYKLCAIVAACFALAACAPISWVRPGTPPAQTAQDEARCQLLARGMNPGGFYASGKPAFVAAAAVVSILGTAAGQAVDYRNCMLAGGYTPEAPQAQANVAPAPAAMPVAAVSAAALQPQQPVALPAIAVGPAITPCLTMTCQ